MQYKIALLLRKEVIETHKKLIGDTFLGCDIDYYKADSLRDLRTIFPPIEKKYDGFIASGSLSACILSKVRSDEDTPLAYFTVSVESIYKIILTQSILRKNFELSKIGLDKLNENDSLENIIIENRLEELMKDDYESINKLSIDELEVFENQLIEKYRSFIKKNKINFFITQTVAAFDLFDSYNIDYYCMYPSLNDITSTFELIKKNIELRVMNSNLPAVIHFDLKLDKSNNMTEQKIIEFQKSIFDYNEKYRTNIMLKSSYLDFEVYTDYKTIKNITLDFTCCTLTDFLKKEIGFKGTVCYGIGNNIFHARINAINASKYGSTSNENQNFLIDKNDNLISLDGNCDNTSLNLALEVSVEYIDEIANKAKLSSNTLIRLISLLKSMDTNELSSNELVTNLNMSLRTANKILSSLLKADLAEVIGQKRVGNKGRPINIYKINIAY